MRDEHIMNMHTITLHTATLEARSTGALFWPDQSLLVVSDLHLGKSERIARLGGAMLPPYETRDTLVRLDQELTATKANTVICLGDSFDDLLASQSLAEETHSWLNRLMAGRRWIWIEGNHDPGPVALGGSHLAEFTTGDLTFRHIALPDASAEVSGHYHPKASLTVQGRGVTRACFLADSNRLILPAFGTYTGGLRCTSPELQGLMLPNALAILTGERAVALPMPRRSE